MEGKPYLGGIFRQTLWLWGAAKVNKYPSLAVVVEKLEPLSCVLSLYFLCLL
jgi:hypothetical protein